MSSKFLNSVIFHFLIITAAVFLLYGQSANYEFVLDDKIVITDNNFVKKGIDGIAEIWNNDSMSGFLGKENDLLQGGRYRPLSLIVFAIDYELWELNTYYFHLQNIVFYLLSCFVLYFTLLLLFQFQQPENSKLKFLAFVGTLIFAVHPVHTEAVANIKGLDELLAFLFGCLSFIFVLLFSDKNKNIFAVLGALSFLLSLLAKESTLPLLLAIPVALYFFRNASLKTVFKNMAILFIPTIIYLLIRNNALGFLLNNEINATGIMNDPFFDATTSQKIGTVFYTLLLYVKLLFFPHPLTHDYYPYHIQLLEFYKPLAILSMLTVLFLIGLAIKGIAKRNQYSFVIFYFFVTLSIVSNVVINVGAFMNERFLFVPSFAFSVLIISAFLALRNRKKIQGSYVGILLLAVLGFGFKSFTRIPVWQNLRTLNEAAIQVSKNSARANCFYGVSLYQEILADSIAERKLENTKIAQKYINRSLEIYPEYADALRMKAGLAAELYKLKPDADKLLNEFVEINRVRHVNYVDEFTNWLERRTDKIKMADYYFKTGYEIYGVEKRNFTLATFYLDKGIKLVPTHKNLLFGNSVIGYLTSDFQKCIQNSNQFLNLYGQNADILFYLGNAQIKSGDPIMGNKNLNLAYQLKPALKK